MTRLLLAVLLLVVGFTTQAVAAPNPGTPYTERFSANQTSYTSTSTIPLSANVIASATFVTYSGGALTNPTVTRDGVTWTRITSVEEGSGIGIEIHFYCVKTGGSSSNATLTADFGATTMSNLTMSVIEWAGADTSGACQAAFLQNVIHDAAVTSTTTLTFAAFGSTNNRPFVMAAKHISGSQPSMTAEAGWVELYDLPSGGAESGGGGGMWRDDTSDTTGTITWSSATSGHSVGIGTEVVGAAVAGGGVGIIGGGVGKGILH